MSKMAIFVSDLHLGRGDELEDFVPENEAAFVEFLGKQSVKHMGQELDLVLLGDSLDIWQVATDQEKTAVESKEIEIALIESADIDRVRQVVSKHPNTFAALGRFLKADVKKRRNVIVPGNHDHSLIRPDIQRVIREAIAAGDANVLESVLFSHYYDESDLRTYAEHGNQYDVNNDYDDFSAFGPECPGYYFVRLFWNRLEPKEPNADVWLDSFRAIWQQRLWRLLPFALRLFKQYRNDPRPFERIDVPGVPFFAADGQPVSVPVTGKPVPESPDILISDSGDPERIFSTDDATENRLRALYHEAGNEEFKKVMDEILDEKFHGQPPAVPSKPVPSVPEFGIFQDEYVTATGGMFAPPGQSPSVQPMCGHALTTKKYSYVLFGHTHDEKEKKLTDLDVTYLNTGSWSVRRDPEGRNISRLCFVTIERKADRTLEAVLDYWKLK
jgi:UDP-2,3-diacylglucosamine pyrophosphatase LpxH